MNERKLFPNTFNQTAINNRRYRWVALASSLITGGLLTLYLLN